MEIIESNKNEKIEITILFQSQTPPFKVIKNVFYFMFKAFLVLKYLHFCPDFLVM